jgi:tRNA pseudouridine55 synthase
MDGLLIVDKPAGPTSHDVVAIARRVLGERRVGHTGTLDPAATGVLPLVLGRATRLARFLSNSDKEYEARVRLGIATDTYDADGLPVGPAHTGAWPSREDVERALDAFRGTFLQTPPVFSAKKIDGQRSYALARAARLKPRATTEPHATTEPRATTEPLGTNELRAAPEAVLVTARAIEVVAVAGDIVDLCIECSSGFYVRSLAHDVGERLGIGAHLAALRRSRSADFSAAEAIPLDDIVRDPARAIARVVPLAAMLPRLPAVVLNGDGEQYLAHGREIAPAHVIERREGIGESIRLIAASGELLGVAEPSSAPGFLHPCLVLM